VRAALLLASAPYVRAGRPLGPRRVKSWSSSSVRKRRACTRLLLQLAVNNIRVLYTQRHNHRSGTARTSSNNEAAGVGSAAQYPSRNECFVPLSYLVTCAWAPWSGGG
jgi:hypothetical protein